MASLILKPECSFFTIGTAAVSTSPSGLGKAMLLLSKITGAMLAGIGVMVLFANVLLGSMSLLVGPDFAIRLLVQ
ncbi:MAG TPA: hypothetical protein VHS05_13905 [Pyrinomonadaceae bacterium]|jgi:hypothetical protein|nr:hypothetical protein [Pyrinomonadaceae bacterium]